MITITEADLYKAMRAAYAAIDEAAPSADPDIYKEDTAVFLFKPGYQDPDLIEEQSNKLQCIFEKAAYFPHNESLKVEAENEYWTEKLVSEKYLDNAIGHINKMPLSRSCLYNFWDNDDFNTANPKGNCITQIYLRLRGDKLEMHSHIRANDVHRCLFMDLAYLMYAHQYIAEATGHRKGAFIHFVDSLHIYNKSVKEFKKQLAFMQEPAGIWTKR